ncbi:N-acetylmuramoyl-L-alanine amidase [Petroclostridium sp. X23]|uniref:N-acetylmuramoyl-L-alanine amidase n=1 Tax=Petroclostridium sp. X23 TaxID=3045146 RepID=UPI0024AE32EF|nr:N-acetylmuramoyl-L-alanine amidase [Petroclostridium sp. X23]WHH58365.1 N-acetylmuramoyl-L-alanine amidase [Petroclostridium sp. X23]
MKLVIDPGHGGSDPGAVGSYSKEKDINLLLSLKLKNKLTASGISVICTREDDSEVSLQKRCDIANNYGADYFISMHCNSAKDTGASGTETYCLATGGKAYELAKVLQQAMIEFNNNKDRGVKVANYYVLKYTNMPAVIIETMFLSNQQEEERLNNTQWQDLFTSYLAEAICVYLGFTPVLSNKTPIMGGAEATAKQMDIFLRKFNADAPYLAELYLKVGKLEGVRGDLAFAQSILETGYFRFEGAVSKAQNNFAGLGATGNGVQGAVFGTPEEGITAQIQHLKAYATTNPLNTVQVDPRFNLVQRGSAPYWEDLNGKWAVPGNGYGENVVKIWNEILTVSVENQVEHYAQEAYDEWKAKGIVLEDHDLNTPITWGEYVITQQRIKNLE